MKKIAESFMTGAFCVMYILVAVAIGAVANGVIERVPPFFPEVAVFIGFVALIILAPAVIARFSRVGLFGFMLFIVLVYFSTVNNADISWYYGQNELLPGAIALIGISAVYASGYGHKAVHWALQKIWK